MAINSPKIFQFKSILIIIKNYLEKYKHIVKNKKRISEYIYK